MKVSQCNQIFLSYCLILLLLVATNLQSSSAFSVSNNNNNKISQSTESSSSSSTRKDFLKKASLAVFGSTVLLQRPELATAAEEVVELPTRDVVTSTFDPIRYELNDPSGGVAYMQQRIDEQDFPGLMEFTKGYDLELRKLRMGKAKKLIQSKDVKEEATGYANAVTFDLIGINRNSRKGQENVEGANKYLQELRDDVAKFLTVESTIQVQ